VVVKDAVTRQTLYLQIPSSRIFRLLHMTRAVGFTLSESRSSRCCRRISLMQGEFLW
jgi:hypothetical protein